MSAPTLRIKEWRPRNAAIADCWALLATGIDAGMLDDEEVGGLVEALRNHQDLILDELAFEFLGDALRVRFLSETGTCSPQRFLMEVCAAIQDPDRTGAAYTKQDFGRDLLFQLDDGYDPVRIARWAYTRVIDPQLRIEGPELRDLIISVVAMEEGPEFEYSETELRELAERCAQA